MSPVFLLWWRPCFVMPCGWVFSDMGASAASPQPHLWVLSGFGSRGSQKDAHGHWLAGPLILLLPTPCPLPSECWEQTIRICERQKVVPGLNWIKSMMTGPGVLRLLEFWDAFLLGGLNSEPWLPGTVPGTVVWKENSPLILGFIEILSLIEILWPRNEVFPVTLIILCEIVKITYPGFSVIQGMASFFIKSRLGMCPQCRWVIIAAVPVVALVSGEPVDTERTVFHPLEQLDWMEHSTE